MNYKVDHPPYCPFIKGTCVGLKCASACKVVALTEEEKAMDELFGQEFICNLNESLSIDISEYLYEIKETLSLIDERLKCQ